MLAEMKPDVVDIITPPDTHLATLRAVLDFRPKVIICQKPFCASLKEARLAVALAKDADVPLVIHENFRFQPWYRKIKSLIDKGALGDVLQLSFRLRPGDGQGARAYLERQPYFQTMPRFLLHETGVHWVDTFRFLMGSPDAVFADLRRLNPAIAGEDAGYFLFRYKNGARALFDGNRHLDHASENPRLTFGGALIEGTGGTLALPGDGALWQPAFGAAQANRVFAPRGWPGFAGDCVHALQSHVAQGLRSGAGFENEAQDYLSIIEAEEAIYRSAETHARVTL